MNEKLKKGREEYLRKLKLGEVTRLDPIEKSFANPRSLRYAINAKCWDCCCYVKKEITLCEIIACPLHRFRPYQVKQD